VSKAEVREIGPSNRVGCPRHGHSLLSTATRKAGGAGTWALLTGAVRAWSNAWSFFPEARPAGAQVLPFKPVLFKAAADCKRVCMSSLSRTVVSGAWTGGLTAAPMCWWVI